MRIVVVCLLLCFTFTAAAQPDADVQVDEISITSSLDAFGLEVQAAEGFITNMGTDAYQDISLTATVYDADDNVIGEGFGYPVLACGEALLPDFALQPGMSETFSVPLDLFEFDAEIERVDIAVDAQAVTPDPAMQRLTPADGLTEVTPRETVQVEWLEPNLLRYSVGCWRDIFNERSWYEYDLNTGASTAIEHPRANDITDTTRRQINLTDPLFFSRSFFIFGPGERRAVYQNDLNTIVTAEPDGSFLRVLYDRLATMSLQGIYFPEPAGGVFIASYHGGPGDEVRYLTANVNGQQLSQHPMFSLPSVTSPGVAATGQRVIIGAEIDGTTGYYIKATNTDFIELLFEVDALPGNNWPPPVYHIDAENQRRLYVAQPSGDGAALLCYNRESATLHNLTDLPLRLDSGDRAWMWLSPDAQTLALAANGIFGGLWLADLSAFTACD